MGDFMKYGYARVSTIGQDLEAQIQALEHERCDKIFSEKFTGTKRERPQFQELLSLLKEGDTLVVTKLDRFARSAVDAIQIIRNLFEQGVKVHVLNMGLIENTPTGKLILTIMSGFAEFERDMIVERTQEGKAIAKQREDFREGRPKKFKKAQIEHALKLLETNSYKQVEDITGISKSTLIRAKNSLKNKVWRVE
jgi:DNA invertase Pin-like site-specific DNA recombinase